MMESHGITINRTNPDPEDFYMNRLINQIYKHISQSNKKNLEKEKSRNKKAKKQNKRTRKQNKRTKEQVWKRIIKLCV